MKKIKKETVSDVIIDNTTGAFVNLLETLGDCAESTISSAFEDFFETEAWRYSGLRDRLLCEMYEVFEPCFNVILKEKICSYEEAICTEWIKILKKYTTLKEWTVGYDVEKNTVAISCVISKDEEHGYFIGVQLDNSKDILENINSLTDKLPTEVFIWH